MNIHPVVYKKKYLARKYVHGVMNALQRIMFYNICIELHIIGIILWNAFRTEIKRKNTVSAFKKVTKTTLSVNMDNYL